MAKTNLNEFLIDAKAFSDEDLKFLAEGIYTIRKIRNEAKQIHACSNLNIGQKVWFRDRHGRRVEIVISEIRGKRVRGHEGTTRWSVAPTLLHQL
jgi:hypothetical protein